MSLLRIDKIFNFEKGVLQSTKCVPGNYDFITASSDWKTHNKYTHDCEALIFAASASGSLGRTHYVNGKFVSSDLCFIITPKDQENFPVDLKFYHILFNELKEEIVRNTKAGTSKEAIGLRSFGKYELPYFDIDTQIKIKNRFVSAEDYKTELSNELTQQVDLVKKLHQQLLQDAIQGKLVSQDFNDEPASELLKKIKSEKSRLVAEKKLKKQKELLPIEPEEVPFEIPENWVWCRFQEITKLITCGIASTPKYYSEGRVFLSAKNVKPFNFMPEEHKFVDEETYQKITRNAKPEINDILVTRVGAGIGESAIIDKEIDFAFYVSLTLIKPFKDYLNSKFLLYFLNSPQGVKNAITYTSGGKSSQGNLNVDKVRNFLIPLPPLSEQNRIVEKLDRIINFCDDLEASIKESELQNDKLLQQVLREAFSRESQ